MDNAFLRYAPDRWYLHEERVHCPLMMGSTNNEFRIAPHAEDDATLMAYAAKIPGLDQAAFLKQFTSPATKESIAREGDVNAIEFAVRAAGVRTNETIYAYEFSAEIPGWDHPGAFHSVDLWFFFETLAKCWRPFTGKHYDLARQMCDYLVNFVRGGDPNGMGTDGTPLPYWPVLKAEAPVFQSFGDTVKPVQSPASPLTKLLLDAYLSRSKPD